ncbi:hypothetical protein B0H14DRAFT_3538860 [Mycena olivaceomarginata]|nr:hypothetical protein B0H14DRAFT_3538860 [Mycena olivaceomarginata]
MSLHRSPEDDSNLPKSAHKNDFEEYLRTRTPGIPDPPSAEVPDFSKDGTLDHYSNEVQDRFFILTKAGNLTVNETRELMYYYVMLRLVDHSGPNHENYSILYNNCIDVTLSLEADDINNSYQPSAKRGYDSTNPSLRRTFYADLLHWRRLSDQEKAEIKALGSNPHSENISFLAMHTISDDEDEDKMASEKQLPPLPTLPRGLSNEERYNIQQKLEPDARAVLMRALHRKLNKREGKYLRKLVELLRGNGKLGGGMDDIDEDIEMPDVEQTDEKTALPFLELMIRTWEHKLSALVLYW